MLYATCVVHEGWEQVGEDGSIPLSDQVLGGHAFAIVAYDDEGFWLQNSWGSDWGQQGFARISYDDWLRNGTDVWVARLGAPVTLRLAQSTAAAHSAIAGESIAYSFADLRPHIVSIGNDGRLRAGGDYGSTPDGLRNIFEQRPPARDATAGRASASCSTPTAAWSASIRRCSGSPTTGRRCWRIEVYPLALIWKTDYWTTIGNVLQDAVRRRRPEGRARRRQGLHARPARRCARAAGARAQRQDGLGRDEGERTRDQHSRRCRPAAGRASRSR